MGSISTTDPRAAEKVEVLLDRLRRATDGELDRLRRMLSEMILEEQTLGGTDPFSTSGVGIAFAGLIVTEVNRRQSIIRSTEADLKGGHLVEVGTGDRPGTFAATCVPDLEAGAGCWEGPDRTTVAEALGDGRRHHPGYEPRVWEWLR
jgi:hypothetical protein